MRRPDGSLVAVVVLILGAATGCSGDPADADNDSSSPRTTTDTPSAASDPATPTPTTAVAEECEDAPGRVVEQLPDVTIPATELPAVVDEDGEEVAEPSTIPAQLVDGGCVIRFDAPGGCLGAVRITGVEITAVTIPELVLDDRTYPAVTADAAQMPAVESPQVCQVVRDGRLGTVTRAGVVREGFSRDGVARPGDDLVPTVRLEPVRVPDVDVDPARLTSRPLPGRDPVDVLDGQDRTAYVAPASVLFDTDQATIRPEAAAALREIARRIRATAAGRPVTVEGHTDDQGDAAYGQALSERRARAVAKWLVQEAGFDPDLITTRGFGETAPAVPNTSAANRQQNRRVVIVVGRR